MSRQRATSQNDVDAREVAAMLRWFKAQLPQHELGRWLITQHSKETIVLENDGPAHRHYAIYDHGYVRIRGYAECVRCQRRFDIPDIGNFITSPKRVDATVARAKKWVEGIADRDGPCWGDVPKADNRECYATIDNLRAVEPEASGATKDQSESEQSGGGGHG